MKRLLKLILPEVSFLKKTLAVILVTLTAFSAAFAAVISVLLDTPQGMIAGADASRSNYFEIYGGEGFALSAKNRTIALAEEMDAELAYGEKSGVTYNAVLKCNGSEFKSDIVTQLGSGDYKLEYRVKRRGYIIPLQYAHSLDFLHPIASERGILLCSEAAEELGAAEGDDVVIGDKTYPVIAVFERADIAHDYAPDESVVPEAWYFVVDDFGYKMFDTLHIAYASCETLHEQWAAHSDKVKISKFLVDWHDRISTVCTYYGALALLLGVLILILLYVLFSVLFRVRKGHICRYKLLGATNATVASVYLAIVMMLLAVAVIVSTALSAPLSIYLLNICTRLFGVSYGYHFRVWLPFAMFGAFALCAVTIFLVTQRKISRLPIAEEVRCE